MLTNPNLKPVFKYAASLNSADDIKNSAKAKAHGLAILMKVNEIVENINDAGKCENILQTLGTIYECVKTRK